MRRWCDGKLLGNGMSLVIIDGHQLLRYEAKRVFVDAW
jgi:hypothetical protein